MEDIPVNSQTLEPTAPCALCGEALTSYHAFGEQVWHHKEGFYAPHKDTDCFLAQTAIKRGLKAMKWNTVMSALTAAQARIVELSAEVERLKVERVHLAEFAWKHIGEDLMAMTPQEAVAAFNATQVK